MSWLKKARKWILGAITVIGAIALYILMSKDKTDEKVAALEDKIGEKEKEIKKWEEERNKHLDSADDASKEGKKLDKEIENAKTKKVNLDEKREKMKNIFDKYNGGNGNG